MQYVNILHVSYVHMKYNHMGYLELRCNLVLTFRSEIVEVAFNDIVLNLEIAVYCTHSLQTVYLITYCSRWNSKLLYQLLL